MKACISYILRLIIPTDVLLTLDQWGAADELIMQLDDTQQSQEDILSQIKDLLFTLQAAYDIVDHISKATSPEA